MTPGPAGGFASTGTEAHLPGRHDQSTHGRGGGIRQVLKDAKTTDAVAAATAAEVKRIAGRDIPVSFAGQDVQIAREHADGILRGLEKYPNAPLTEIGTYGAGAAPGEKNDTLQAEVGTAFAATSPGGMAPTLALPNGNWTTGAGIYFNNDRTADVVEYRAALDRMRVDGFSVAGTPRGAAIHEFGHVMQEHGYPDRPASLVSARARAEAGPDANLGRFVSNRISRYAATNDSELTSEAFTDSFINGTRAAGLSRALNSELERSHLAWFALPGHSR